MSRKGISGEILAFIVAMIILLFFILIWTGVAGKIVDFFLEKLPIKIVIHRE